MKELLKSRGAIGGHKDVIFGANDTLGENNACKYENKQPGADVCECV